MPEYTRQACIEYLEKHYKANLQYRDISFWTFANNVSFVYTLPFSVHKLCFDIITDNPRITAQVDKLLCSFKDINPKYGAYRSETNDNCIVLMHRVLIDGQPYNRYRKFDLFPYNEFSDEQLVSRVKLLQQFDKLCDQIVDVYVNEIKRYSLKLK
jgi:hypothetical protein